MSIVLLGNTSFMSAWGNGEWGRIDNSVEEVNQIKMKKQIIGKWKGWRVNKEIDKVNLRNEKNRRKSDGKRAQNKCVVLFKILIL